MDSQEVIIPPHDIKQVPQFFKRFRYRGPCIKGLIFKNAQGYSLDTRLYVDEGPPSYKKQQRKKL